MSLEVKCFPYGLYQENTYVIIDEASAAKAVIDPGYLSVDVRMAIESAPFLKYILLTHGHHDHYLEAEQYVKDFTHAKFAVPEKDREILYERQKTYPIPEADMYLKEGDVITLGSTEIRVIETPGHTGGGICFVTDNEVFTGDTLFRYSVGRTDLPTGNWEELQKSIRAKLYTLDESLIVYPGHGEPTTIGDEKRSNPFV